MKGLTREVLVALVAKQQSGGVHIITLMVFLQNTPVHQLLMTWISLLRNHVGQNFTMKQVLLYVVPTITILSLVRIW